MEPLVRQIILQGRRTEASEAPPTSTGVGKGLGSQVQGREQERGFLLQGAPLPGSPAPLLSGPQEKPGRTMLGRALKP